MNNLELAWLAGLLEGEGCFYLTYRKNKDGSPRPLVSVMCSMTDEDVVRKAACVAGSGYVYRRDGRKGCKPSWTWQDSKVERVAELITRLRPFMGVRRQAKIDELLAAIAGWERRPVRSHGERRMYVAGCRCFLCKRANAQTCLASKVRARQSGDESPHRPSLS